MSGLSHKPKDYQKLFTECLLETFTILYRVYPDHKHLRKVEGKLIKIERATYTEYTLNNLKPHISQICSQDEGIFSVDYSPKPLFLLVGLDFKKIWKAGLSAEDKESIFNQLQLLFIYGSLALRVNKPLVRDMIENLKFTSGELDQKVAEAEAEEQAKSQFSLEAIFGKNNPIAELFMEVTQDQELRRELGLEDPRGPQGEGKPSGLTGKGPQGPQGPQASPRFQAGADNPMEVLVSLLQADKLENLVNVFKTRLEAKMKARNLTYEDIQRFSRQTTERLRRKFTQNPIMKSLQLDKMIDKLMESINRAEETEMETNPEETPDFQTISRDLIGMVNNLQQKQHLQLDPDQVQQMMAQMQQQNPNLTPEEIMAQLAQPPPADPEVD